MAGTSSDQLKQEYNRRYSFLKKRKKAQKISRNELQHEFVHRGWDTCSFEFKGESNNLKRVRTKYASSSLDSFDIGSMKDVQIAYSPSKSEKGDLEKNICSIERKSMLVDIGNIKAEFINHQPESCFAVGSWNSKISFPALNDENKGEKILQSKKQPKKLTTSVLFKLQDIEAVFKDNKAPVYKKSLTNSENRDDFESAHPSETTLTSDDNQDGISSHHEQFKNLYEYFSSSFIKDRKDYAINTLAKTNCYVVAKKDNSSENFSDLLSFKQATEVSIEKSCDIINTEFSIKSAAGTSQNAKILHHLYSVPNLRTLLKGKASSGDKGSSWVQSIKWSDISTLKDDSFDCVEQAGENKFRGLLPGGFAEQMLKLQRREKSDKVIWDHKLTDMRKRDSKNFLTFNCFSVMHFGEIIVTKCFLIDCFEADYDIVSNAENLHCDTTERSVSSCMNSLQTGTKTYIVLFKKSVFHKNHLKQKGIFRLFQPWHIVSVPSLSCPVILCTYFIDVFELQQTKDHMISVYQEISVKSNIGMQNDSKQETMYLKDVHYNMHTLPKNSAEQQNIHNLWRKCISVAARIQRIWRNKICCENVNELMKIKDYLSFSVLLQTKEGTFCILKIKTWSGCLPKFWFNLISNDEGACYIFHNLKLTYRYHVENYPELFEVLKNYMKTQPDNSEAVMPQDICYQLIPQSLHEIPDKVEDNLFPKFCSFKILALTTLLKVKMKKPRFSCFGKVIFHTMNYFYLTDESLLNSQVQYIRFKFFYPVKMVKESLVGTIVLITEAVIIGEILVLDEYSSCKIMSLDDCSSLSKVHQNRLKNIASISVHHIVPSLIFNSTRNDVVYVQGTITHVDANSAVSWLECCFCFMENLLQGDNSIIYCEDCSCVVPKPILKVKMEVTVNCPYVSEATVSIMLLPCTIKTLLKISDDSYEPECNIDDVLNKKISSLLCYVRDCKIIDGKKCFYLTEIE